MSRLLLLFVSAAMLVLITAQEEGMPGPGGDLPEVTDVDSIVEALKKDEEGEVGGEAGLPGPPGPDGTSRRPPPSNPCNRRLYHRFVRKGVCSGYVLVSSCSGKCSSSAFTFPGNYSEATYSYCQCCQMTNPTRLGFPFSCQGPNGPYFRHYYYTVYNGCSCEPCGRYPTITSNIGVRGISGTAGQPGPVGAQ